MNSLVIPQILRSAARRHPNREAVVDLESGQTRNYRELEVRAEQVAAMVAALDLRPGTPVAVVLANSVEFLEVIYGLAIASRPIVPISYRLPAEDIAYLLGDSAASLLIFHHEFKDRVEGALAALDVAARPRLVEVGKTRVSAGCLSYESALERAPRTRGDNEPEDDDVFYFGYTSGTTGRPKGALISHKSRFLAAVGSAIEFRLLANDRTLVVAPMYHGAPLISVLSPAVVGGTAYLLPRFDAAEVASVIERHAITDLFLVPTQFNLLIAGRSYRRHWPRVAISAGSPLLTHTKEKILETWPGVQLHEYYGSSEGGIVASLQPEDQLRKERCVGQPFFTNEVRVLREDGNECEPGEVGEIASRGPMVFEGYHRLPEQTQTALRGGWLRLGDLGKTDDEGYFYLVDRKNDLIVTGGVNVFPREVEEVVESHPAVLEVAAVGAPDPTWGEIVIAVVVPRPGSQLDTATLAGFCKDRLASHQRPREFRVVQELPHNPAGKLLRRQVRAEFWQDQVTKI